MLLPAWCPVPVAPWSSELGGRAIRFVVFDGPPDDPVVGELDATVGLRQLARAPEQSLWLVAGNPTRAELSATGGESGGSAADPIEVPILTTPTTVDVVLHPQTQLPRRLLVAERAELGLAWCGVRNHCGPAPRPAGDAAGNGHRAR